MLFELLSEMYPECFVTISDRDFDGCRDAIRFAPLLAIVVRASRVRSSSPPLRAIDSEFAFMVIQANQRCPDLTAQRFVAAGAEEIEQAINGLWVMHAFQGGECTGAMRAVQCFEAGVDGVEFDEGIDREVRNDAVRIGLSPRINCVWYGLCLLRRSYRDIERAGTSLECTRSIWFRFRGTGFLCV